MEGVEEFLVVNGRLVVVEEQDIQKIDFAVEAGRKKEMGAILSEEEAIFASIAMNEVDEMKEGLKFPELRTRGGCLAGIVR